jgi:hypothetical protein
MAIEKLERVMWRIRTRNPNKNQISNDELWRCIIYECGYTEATRWRVRTALIKLGWLTKWKTRSVRLTNKDLTTC